MSNYICVKNGETVKRVLRKEADKLVATAGWSYCPKSLWREKVRDVNRAVIAENVREAQAASSEAPRKKQKPSNLKGKARKVAEQTEAPKAETV